MSYDPNSIEAQKGALGEKIVKEFLSGICDVKKPRDTFKSGASIVDFYCRYSSGEEFFAEVKTQVAKLYGVENAPCYSFPKSRVTAYAQYQLEHNAPVSIYIVDPAAGYIFSQSLGILEQETYIDARKFPFDKHNDALNSTFHYWHQNQFYTIAINEQALAELRALFELETKTQTTSPAKELADRLAAFVNVGKKELVCAILALRQEKFDREQAQMKELLT